MSTDNPAVAALDLLEAGVDHLRGPEGAAVVLEYGDYECPYSRLAFREFERVERAMNGSVRFAYRRYPPLQLHALGAARASRRRQRLEVRRGARHADALHQRPRAPDEDDAATLIEAITSAPAR